MADPANDYQLPPQQESVVALKAYRDIRAEISEMDKKGIELQKISAKFSRDDQATLKEKRAEIEYTTKNIQKQMKEQAEMITKRGYISDDIERNAFEKLVKSHNQKMAFEKETLDGLKQEADLFVKMRADQIEAQGKSAKYFGSALKFGFDNLGIQSKELTNVQNIYGKLKEFPELAGGWGKLLAIGVTLLISTYDLFLKFDKAAWDFRKAMGVTRPDVADLRKSTEESAISMMNLGVTTDDLYNVTKALGSEMGGIRNVSADLRDNMALVKAQLGVSEETSARFLRNMAAIAGKSMISQKNAVYIAGSLSAAAGTNLNQVMGDVANASSVTLSLMGRMPNQMLRTAIEARRFNTSINDVARANRTVLDFTTSIQDEMEASVLLGHSINLQKLRQLSFEGDEEAAMKERIRLAEKEDFLNIKNVFQKEALAKALGTSVEDLTKQLQVNKEIDRMRNSADPKEREALKRYEDKLALSEKDMNIEGEKFRLGRMNEGNQERITNIANSYHKIMAQIGKVFLPYIDVTLKFIADHMDIILGIGTGIWGIFRFIKPSVSDIATKLAGWGDSLKTIADFKNWKWLETVSGWVENVGIKTLEWLVKLEKWGNKLKSLFEVKSLTRFAGMFRDAMPWAGRLLRLVGDLIIPLMFAYHIFMRIRDILNDKAFMNMTNGWKFFGLSILRAIGAIILALTDVVDDFTFGLFYKILGALKGPFVEFGKWISEKVPHITGMGTLFANDVQPAAAASYIPMATITPQKTTLAESLATQATMPMTELPSKWDELLAETKIHRQATEDLVSLLKSGKIQTNTYMDGTLLSTNLARSIDIGFGSFGVNK